MDNDRRPAKAAPGADPYRAFKFRLMWEGRCVAGVSRVSGLKRTTEAVKLRSGGDPSSAHISPGQTGFEPITLERGVTHDPDFEQWANQTWNYHNSTLAKPQGPAGGKGGSLRDFRRDLTLELYNEAGKKVLTYRIYRCWVSEFIGLPELDAKGNACAIRSLVLQNEGWERDANVEPEEPDVERPS